MFDGSGLGKKTNWIAIGWALSIFKRYFGTLFQEVFYNVHDGCSCESPHHVEDWVSDRLARMSSRECFMHCSIILLVVVKIYSRPSSPLKSIAAIMMMMMIRRCISILLLHYRTVILVDFVKDAGQDIVCGMGQYSDIVVVWIVRQDRHCILAAAKIVVDSHGMVGGSSSTSFHNSNCPLKIMLLVVRGSRADKYHRWHVVVMS